MSKIEVREKRAGAIIIKDKKILLVSDGGSGVYWTPGGRLNTGENYEAALFRELHEELGVKISTYKKYFDYVSPPVEVSGEFFPETEIKYFLVEIEGAAKPSSEIGDLKWCNRNDVSSLKLSNNTSRIIVPRVINDNLI